MKRILHYYFSQPKSLERSIENNTYGIIFLIAFSTGVLLSKYANIAYLAGFLVVFIPLNLHWQYKKIKKLESSKRRGKE